MDGKNIGLTNTVVTLLWPSILPTRRRSTPGREEEVSSRARTPAVTWKAFGDGLRNPTVNALAIDPSMPGRLHAGTGGGVFDFEVFSSPRILPPGGERKPRQVAERP